MAIGMVCDSVEVASDFVGLEILGFQHTFFGNKFRFKSVMSAAASAFLLGRKDAVLTFSALFFNQFLFERCSVYS